MFLWGLEGTPKQYYKFFAENWYQVCKTGDELHQLSGTNFERIRKREGVMRYVSKYICKEIDEAPDEFTGRCWGQGGEVPISEKVEKPLGIKEKARLLRLLRRSINVENKGIRYFFIKQPDFWEKRHQDICDPVTF